MMKTQPMLIALTIVNAVLLLGSLTLAHRTAAQAQDVAPVLRGRALEIVDDHGRVRAEIRVCPAQPTLKMPDGTTGYPETVLLRLTSSQGAPNTKLVTTEDGSGLYLGGEPGYVQILGRGTDPVVRLVKKDGRQQTIKPERGR
jgi:hypothetical protein